MRTNAICWNPMEAFNFVTANEDHNAYYYDMRNLSRSLNVFKDHVSAVMDVDFSPTGMRLLLVRTIRVSEYIRRITDIREKFIIRRECSMFSRLNIPWILNILSVDLMMGMLGYGEAKLGRGLMSKLLVKRIN